MPLPAGRQSPLSPDIQLPPSLTLALVGIYFSDSNRTAIGDGGSWSILIVWRLGLGNKQSHPKLVDRGRAAPNGLVVALLAAQLRVNWKG